MAITRWPSASKRSLKCDPRNPAPPVTTETGFGRADIWDCVLIASDTVCQRFPASRNARLPYLKGHPNESEGSLICSCHFEDSREFLAASGDWMARVPLTESRKCLRI